MQYGNKVIRAGIRQKGEILSLIALPLMMKVLGNGVIRAGVGVRRAGKGYNNKDRMDKDF